MNNTPRNSDLLRTLWGWLPVVILMVMAVTVLVLLGRVKAESKRLKAEKAAAIRAEIPPVNVVTLAMVPKRLTEAISFPAMTEPWLRLTVQSEVTGKIEKKQIREGDPVKQGSPLCSVDKRDYRLSHHAAAAAYKTAQASYDRIFELHGKQLSTRSLLDAASADLESARSAMDTAALRLERCDITASTHGIIDKVYVEEGQYISVGDPIADILQLDRIKVNVGIPESDISDIRNLTDFTVEIDALDRRPFPAKKYYLSRSADPLAKLYRLEVMIDNPSEEILPDMFSRVTLVKKAADNALSVPVFAVISQDDRHFVFVASDDTATRKAVTLGIHDGWEVEIADGLSEDDRVIVVGQRDLTDGQPIRVLSQVTDTRELR
ncbi:MAG: hypothetical protein CSA22_06685 [Deltaproteobacteria bacterium]|nr:MAG: hypothetical protein CSA22_06685 [Deltaproteobacteria bacterium]